ncbi:lantibiotic dehydratase [Kitasatospora sp. NPDC048545]|uniref:lantibiotic dehydratase n=1 Tax=Kitasatospora sp. NPDC048545 TaxID=3157208 RepID=UPI0033D21814
MYRAVGPAVLRASAWSRETVTWPDLASGSAAELRSWLQVAWADPALVSAVEVAAGAQLGSRVRAVIAGKEIGSARLRRLTTSVMHYVLRAQGRATPFGLFAGVTAVPFGREAVAPEWGPVRAVARPDSRWLKGKSKLLEELLAERLPVIANNLHVEAAGRIVLPVTPHPADRMPVEVSVRATRAVRAALHEASTAIGLGTLADRVADQLPRAQPGQIRLMLGELLRQRLLISALHPPMTAVDPLGHLLAGLAELGAHDVPQAAWVVDDLGLVADSLDRHNRLCEPGVQRKVRQVLTSIMAESGDDRPLMVDLRLDVGPVALPEQVAAYTARAAELLTRLSPQPRGNPSWLDYHARYIERYGPGAVIPVTELVNPDTGLGLPARYRDSSLPDVPARLGRRDGRLLAMAQKATVEGTVEIAMDKRIIERLAVDQDPELVQPSAELTVHLGAASPAALNSREFTVTVVAVPRAAGTTTARFLHLIDGALREDLEDAICGVPTLRADALPVQLSVPPLFTKVENVARVPALLPVLSLGEYSAPGRPGLQLDELGVCADEHRMWLVTLADRRPVEVRVLNAVEFRAHTQPIARFLCEITNAFTPVLTGFDWGAAGRLPFLPRLRHGRIVLSPARWNLPATDLPAVETPWGEWEKAARAWLSLYRVPALVYLTRRDLKLPLDLDQAAHLFLLREHLFREPSAVLTEAPIPGSNGWCGGRAHEITVQLRSTRAPLPATRRRPARCTGAHDGHLPGASRWLYARLYGNPNRADAVLERMPVLLGQWTDTPQWWFLRHTDPDPHLRLRLLLPDAAPWTLAGERMAEWSSQLRADGLITRLQLDTYQPETGRYGEGAALRQAEAVFAADSRAVIAQLAYVAAEKPDRAAVTAASMTAIATALLGPDTGRSWLLNQPSPVGDSRMPRSVSQQAIALAEQPGLWPALELTATGRAVARAWAERAHQLRTYRQTLLERGELEPEDVIGALLHVHHARAIGIDVESERACRRLARAVALSDTARRPEGPLR